MDIDRDLPLAISAGEEIKRTPPVAIEANSQRSRTHYSSLSQRAEWFRLQARE
jgi:hypothetical protein